MPEKAPDLYGSLGSVPQETPNGPAQPTFSVRATPQDAGAQVGEAQEAAAAQTGEMANKYLGMINETRATNAGAQFEEQLGRLKGDMMSKTGLEAQDALPQFTADVEALRQQTRAGLPLMAAHAFDMYSVKASGYAVSDANSYVSGQIKAANYDSAKNGLSLAALMGNDGTVAASDEQSGYQIGTIKAHAAHMADPDMEHVDPSTGDFKDTPGGQVAKATYQNLSTQGVGQFWENRITTLASNDPLGALKKYTENKEKIPPLAQANIEASLAPKIINAYATGAANQVMGEAAQAHQEAMLDPQAHNIKSAILGQESANGAIAFKSVDGAIGPGQIEPATFAQYAKPGEDINNPSDNRAVSGRIIDDLSQKYKGDPARIAVGYFSGPGNVAPEGSPTPWIADKTDGNGKSVSSYVADVQGRMGGKPPPILDGLSQNYLKNPDGSKLTTADWVSLHRSDLLNRAYEMAEARAPGDLRMRQVYGERATQLIDQEISNQTVRYKQDNQLVQRAITGELTNGDPPASYNELQGILAQHDPDLLNRVWTQDPKYAEGIDTQISKMARRGTDQYSPNGYDAITRTLLPSDNHNSIWSQDQLDRQMGRSDGTGINAKDYHAAKMALDFSDPWKASLLANMKAIAKANGDVDNQGQQRAIQFYEYANRIKNEKDPDGKAEATLTQPDSKDYIGNLKTQYMPSRERQMYNLQQNRFEFAMRNRNAVQARQPNESTNQYLKRIGML